MLLFFLSSLYAQEPSSQDTSDSSDEEPKEENTESSENENNPPSEETTSEDSKENVEDQEQGVLSPEEPTSIPEGTPTESLEENLQTVQEEIPVLEKPLIEPPKENIESPKDPSEETKAPVEQRKNGIVVLKNGDYINGSVLDEGEGARIDIGATDDIYVPESAILTISYPKGKFYQRDRGTSRYFYTPSAMPLKAKSGYVSQKELLFTAVAYSPSQNWSVLAGTSIPTALLGVINFEAELFVGIAGIRYGKEIAENLYIGCGVEAFILPDSNYSLPFVNATYGDSEQHVTLAVALGLANFDTQQADLLPIIISGYKRLTPSTALVTENWLLNSPSYNYVSTNIPIQGSECGMNGEPCYEETLEYDWMNLSPLLFANSIGLRFISKKFTTDIGLVNVISEYGDYIPLPWLDVSWYFGDDTP